MHTQTYIRLCNKTCYIYIHQHLYFLFIYLLTYLPIYLSIYTYSCLYIYLYFSTCISVCTFYLPLSPCPFQYSHSLFQLSLFARSLIPQYTPKGSYLHSSPILYEEYKQVPSVYPRGYIVLFFTIYWHWIFFLIIVLINVIDKYVVSLFRNPLDRFCFSVYETKRYFVYLKGPPIYYLKYFCYIF